MRYFVHHHVFKHFHLCSRSYSFLSSYKPYTGILNPDLHFFHVYSIIPKIIQICINMYYLKKCESDIFKSFTMLLFIGIVFITVLSLRTLRFRDSKGLIPGHKEKHH